MTRYILAFILLISAEKAAAQEITALTIPPKLKENAHAVVRVEEMHISLLSQQKMMVQRRRVVTVLDKMGDKYQNAYVHYDKSVKVKNAEVVVYDGLGKELKKIKQKDFKDQSVADGISLFTDNRVLYADYTPITYPYTLVFTCETETSNTASIPWWQPVKAYNVSVEKSDYRVMAAPELGIRFKEKNFEGFSVENQSAPNQLHYTIANLSALSPEDFSPSLENITPYVQVAFRKFHLEGIDGEAANWQEFGRWMYNNLLQNVKTLSPATISKVKALVEPEKTALEKAAAVYRYVQQNTRYISVQIGIGGWKPMPAGEVDKLGYGDCKALTNYTQSLLEAVGIPSYYTVIYGSGEKESIDPDFTSLQGNHVILGIPHNQDLVFLECTSQTNPFGFQAGFTDDRDALAVTPEGGTIVRTKAYLNEDNYQRTSAQCKLSEDGSLEAQVSLVSGGNRYNYRSRLEPLSEEDKIKSYKEEWGYLNNLAIGRIQQLNDKKNVVFEEKLQLQAAHYANLSGERMLLNLNVFNSNTPVPERYRTRRTPIEIQRGSLEEDVYEIQLPNGYQIEALPENASVVSKFGVYNASFEKTPQGSVRYNRKFLLKKGYYSKEDYTAFRDFMKEIAKFDHLKMVLLKK